MRASEIRMTSVMPCLSSFAGIGRCPHSGMPGTPTGPALRRTMTESASMSSSGSSTRAARVVNVLEDDGTPLVLEQPRIGRRDLHDSPVRTERPAQDDERPVRLKRLAGRRNHLPVDDL